MARSVEISRQLLETFYTLVHHANGNASVAAEALEVDQPTMSRRLRPLQVAGEPLRRPWLVREGKTWKLTAEGQIVLPVVESILQRYNDLTQFAKRDTAARPSLRFACGQLAAAGLVKDALVDFQIDNPEVDLRISTMRGEDRITGVASGSLDLALVTHDQDTIHLLARRQLHVENIDQARLALICKDESRWAAEFNRLAGKHDLPLESLTRFPLIMPGVDSEEMRLLRPTLEAKGLHHRIRAKVEVGGWLTILSYVEAGCGVGVVSDAAVPKDSPLLLHHLDRRACPASVTRLICRLDHHRGPMGLDLNEDGLAWLHLLRTHALRRAKNDPRG